MPETRHKFQEDLRALEAQTLGGLDLVIQQLDRSLESLSYQDVELAGMVVADDDRSMVATSKSTRGSCRCWPARRRWLATCESSRHSCT